MIFLPYSCCHFLFSSQLNTYFYVAVHFSETEDVQWKILWFLPELTFSLDLFTSSISKATVFTWTLLSWHTLAIEIFIETISTDTAWFTLRGYLGKANRLQNKKKRMWDAYLKNLKKLSSIKTGLSEIVHKNILHIKEAYYNSSN